MNWTTRAENLIRTIAGSDLPDDSLCIVKDATADARAAELLPHGAAGITAPWLAPALTAHDAGIVGAGRGGFATIISPDRLTTWGNELRPDLREYVALNAVLHEFAHYAERLAVANRFGLKAHGEAPIDVATALAVDCPPGSPPWTYHGLWFIRAAIHLCHRAREAGFTGANINTMRVADSSYGLSRPARYCEMLGDETERLADVPLSELLGRDSPAEFRELFAADCAAWRAANPQ